MKLGYGNFYLEAENGKEYLLLGVLGTGVLALGAYVAKPLVNRADLPIVIEKLNWRKNKKANTLDQFSKTKDDINKIDKDVETEVSIQQNLFRGFKYLILEICSGIIAIHQDPIDFIDVPVPQHSPKAYYRVVYGDVDWPEDENFRRAIYVVMGYANGISYKRVAHILTTPSEENGLTDLHKVQKLLLSYMSAIE